mgnify:CR=1 FL=1
MAPVFFSFMRAARIAVFRGQNFYFYPRERKVVRVALKRIKGGLIRARLPTDRPLVE